MKKFGISTKAPMSVTQDRIIVGHCYVFMRENHDWHSDTVAVIAEKPDNRFTVARACDVCEKLLDRSGTHRKVKTWTAKSEELF